MITYLVEAWYSLEQYIGLKEDKLSSTTVDFMKSTVVDESLSSFKPMYCSREYQASTRLIQQYEKSTLNDHLSCDFLQLVEINQDHFLLNRGLLEFYPVSLLSGYHLLTNLSIVVYWVL